jgi:hypothetical protein
VKSSMIRTPCAERCCGTRKPEATAEVGQQQWLAGPQAHGSTHGLETAAFILAPVAVSRVANSSMDTLSLPMV